MKLRTLMLWRGLKKPPAEHPLYQRVMTAPIQIAPWYTACIIILVAPLLIIPAILFTSAFYSLRWAMMISSAISRQREAGMFELLALTPAGAFGTSWAISTASIYRNQSLEQIQAPSSWVVRLAFTLIVLASLGNFVEPLVPFDTDGVWLTIIPLVYLFTLAGALYIDHLQSVALGTLVGMLIPTYTRTRIDAGGGALLLFLLLQIVTYTLTIILGFSVLPAALVGLGLSPLALALLLPVARLAIFFLVRESILVGLWAILVERLNIAASEIESMTRP
jgi:hypothetical protein